MSLSLLYVLFEGMIWRLGGFKLTQKKNMKNCLKSIIIISPISSIYLVYSLFERKKLWDFIINVILFSFFISDVNVPKDLKVHCVNIIWMNAYHHHAIMVFVLTKKMDFDVFVNRVSRIIVGNNSCEKLFDFLV